MGGLTGSNPLDGCHVLVIEGEYFLADEIEQELKSFGAKIVGPIADLGTAQDKLRRGDLDVVVIDIRLGEKFAWPIAGKLMRENITFGFATGYGAECIPERFLRVIRWEKPFDLSKLTAEETKVPNKAKVLRSFVGRDAARCGENTPRSLETVKSRSTVLVGLALPRSLQLLRAGTNRPLPEAAQGPPRPPTAP